MSGQADDPSARSAASAPRTPAGYPRPWRIVLAAAGVAVAVMLVDLLLDPLGLKGDLSRVGKDARASLSYSLPDPTAEDGKLIPLTTFDASKMATSRDLRSRGLSFVGPAVPSTGPAVISVNPIDDLTWTAAALSTDGTCFLLGLIFYSADHVGSIMYGESEARPCRGSLATPQTLTDQEWSST